MWHVLTFGSQVINVNRRTLIPSFPRTDLRLTPSLPSLRLSFYIVDQFTNPRKVQLEFFYDIQNSAGVLKVVDIIPQGSMGLSRGSEGGR